MPPRVVCRCCYDYFPTYCMCITFSFWTVVYIMMYCVWHLIYNRNQVIMSVVFMVFYTIFFVMFSWSYFETMCQDPAEVPGQYKFGETDAARVESLDIDRMDETLKTTIALRGLTVLTRLTDMKIRYCRYCHLLKPDRTHHCATCETCSLKMDHHCPWISNCIAFYNYKHFLLTQFYGFLLTLWIMVTIAVELGKLFEGYYDQILVVVVFCTAALAMIFFLVLLGYHLILLWKNETALENKYDLTFITYGLTFSLGCCLNCKEVCGDNYFCWLCPIFSSKGNGYEFSVRGPSTNWVTVDP